MWMKMKDVLKKFRYRKIALAIADGVIIAVTAVLANYLLLAVHASISYSDLMISIMMSVLSCLGCLALCGAYNKMWRYFNAKDYLSCVYGIFVGVAVSCLFTYVMKGYVPLRYVLLHTIGAVVGISLFRFIFKRTFIDLIESGRNESKYKHTMIIGGGQACRMLMSEIRNAQNSPYSADKPAAVFDPVCIIDDDRAKIGTDIQNVQIVGTTSEIDKFIGEFKIEQIVFCIPSCLEDQRKRILDICSATDLPVKVIPFIGNLIFSDTNTSLIGQIRDIKVEDLLGRDPIKFDNEDIKNFISDKVCMVTGGGGSIGSELVRQIAKYDPRRIIIVDICENYAYDIQQELLSNYPQMDLDVRIASVRDFDKMKALFEMFKPELVFHAAAHKHVPLMETSPEEAIKNNIGGTYNVAYLANEYKVRKFVLVSTDKAVNPTNVMGATKRCCEMIAQYFAQVSDFTDFVAVRFGNVLGSNGSVIPLFEKQLAQGGPLTVTHPDIIRYFMTIPEAVFLILQAATLAKGGEIFVLDMGEPVKILDLAENLIKLHGKEPYKDVDIQFTGLRPGEKLFEELLMSEEGIKETQNKKIFIGTQIEIDEKNFPQMIENIRKIASANNSEEAVEALRQIVPTFNHIVINK